MTVPLPPGWAIATLLEHVPDPNFPGITAGPGFMRWTWLCTDENGQLVCASGSEEDCEAQALTAVQSQTQQQTFP